MPGRRTVNLAGAVACAALMAYALYAQYALNLEPCPLCVFQRVAVIALGAVFLLAALHNPGRTGARAYAGLLAATAAVGAGVAGRHVWLQNLPEDEVPACGPGLNYLLDTFSFGEVLGKVFTGSGECATIDWSFLGLSMPAWVLIAVAVLGIWGMAGNWPRRSTA
jgi:disulfide bond formation protein DsbB